MATIQIRFLYTTCHFLETIHSFSDERQRLKYSHNLIVTLFYVKLFDSESKQLLMQIEVQFSWSFNFNIFRPISTIFCVSFFSSFLHIWITIWTFVNIFFALLFYFNLLNASVFHYYYSSYFLPFPSSYPVMETGWYCTAAFSTFNLLAFIFFRMHPFSHFPCFWHCLSSPFLPFLFFARNTPSTAIHAILFFLSSFLSLSSYGGEDCRAISVGPSVTWKMHCPRTLGRIICTHVVCISTAGTVHTQ